MSVFFFCGSSPEERIVICGIYAHMHPSSGVCHRHYIVNFLGFIVTSRGSWALCCSWMDVSNSQASLGEGPASEAARSGKQIFPLTSELTSERNKISWHFSHVSWILKNRMNEENPSLNQKLHQKILLK